MSNITLSPHLKSLIRDQPSTSTLPSQQRLIQSFDSLQDETKRIGVKEESYLLILTAVLITLNHPSSLALLYEYAATHPLSDEKKDKIYIAGYMREVGIRCISFVGVPKVINSLAVLRKAFEEDEKVVDGLSKVARRSVDSSNVDDVQRMGRALWDDIYTPHHQTLLSLLFTSHPDLPSTILQSHYSSLLSPPQPPLHTDLDRESTSVLAVVALRAMGGVEKQVESHVYGLRKVEGRGGGWISGEEGVRWLLITVDRLVDEMTTSR